MDFGKYFTDEMFPGDYSLQEWNALILERFGPFFNSEETILANQQMLRVELVNLVRIEQKAEFFEDLKNIHRIYKEVIDLNPDAALPILNEMLEANNKTDHLWTTFVNAQINPNDLELRDKVAYYFEKIDQISEGVFYPRLAHLYRFTFGLNDGTFPSVAELSLGNLVDRFPKGVLPGYPERLNDPYFGIKLSQWRNIASHKSFSVKRDCITVTYGTNQKFTREIAHGDVEGILNWILSLYDAIRLAQVLMYFDAIPRISAKYDLLISGEMRFDSHIFSVIHNLQLAGFQFFEVTEDNVLYIVSLYQNSTEDLKTSIIHASQVLDRIAFATDIDPMVKGKFSSVAVRIISRETKNALAQATVLVEVALKKIRGELVLAEYIESVQFSVFARQ